MQQLLITNIRLFIFFGAVTFISTAQTMAQPSYFNLKESLNREHSLLVQEFNRLNIRTNDNRQILQLDQYQGALAAIQSYVESLKPHENLFNLYPPHNPRTQAQIDQTITLLILYVHTSEFLSVILPNRALATILSEYSSQSDSQLIARMINKTKFHLQRDSQNNGQRLYKSLERSSRWPITSVPNWLRDYINRAQNILQNPQVLNDRYFVDRPLLDFFYQLKAGILYQTGLISLPKRYFISYEQINEIQNNLLPGDIATIKHLYKLTNVAFQGEWSHGLIYLGSWNKFKNYFDRDRQTNRFFAQACQRERLDCHSYTSYLQKKLPRVISYYKDQMTQHHGHSLPRVVLESKGEGVIISNLYEGLLKDQLAIFRPKMSIKAKAKAIALYTALQYVFRPYDYSFNFQSHGRLVCTEIIFNAYSSGVHSSIPHFNWEQSFLLGQPVVQATDIVKTFAQDYQNGSRKFDFLYFLKANTRQNTAAPSTAEQLVETVL